MHASDRVQFFATSLYLLRQLASRSWLRQDAGRVIPPNRRTSAEPACLALEMRSKPTWMLIYREFFGQPFSAARAASTSVSSRAAKVLPDTFDISSLSKAWKTRRGE